MQLFYAPDLSAEHSFCHLSPEESQHAVKVLRKKMGEQIDLFNGKGLIGTGIITSQSHKEVSLEVINTTQTPASKNPLHIAIAPTKMNERFEWFLEKSTEIGIQRITPLLCDQSERKQINPDRMNRILLSAAKQSLTTFVPQLDELTSVDHFIQEHPNGVIAHCADDSEKNPWPSLIQNTSKGLIIIGPEGDFSSREIALAKSCGWKTCSLGTTRLRTETAGIWAATAWAITHFNQGSDVK
jgi:16S rRNA (uracil1498-N3)-methyltransferase